MGFDFSKNIPKQFNKIKVPEGYEWEVHNLHAYAEKKKAFAEGKITRTQLQEFEHQYRESAEQREWRWRREHIMAELAQQNAMHFRRFKDEGKAFAKKMLDMGRSISMWWWKRPKAPAGKGRMIQNQITGAWQQEYRPNKSMNMRAWLAAAEQGKVMPHMNPKGLPLNRLPTEQEKGISEEAKRQRGKKVWDWVLKETNNFGRGWSDPKWGSLDKSRPGKGGRSLKKTSYTIKS